MSSLNMEFIFLLLQFLDDEKFKQTVHKLEQESASYFNMKHFEDLVQAGEWDEVEQYLGGFTKIGDNKHSTKIFFQIRKQKYLEALDRHDKAKAVDILLKDLKVFESFDVELFKEITMLLPLENFRQNEQLSKLGDTKSIRTTMLMEVKELIKANPLIHNKLTFPTIKASRLRTLINQSLNWQHHLCQNPHPDPEIETLFTDHSCAAPAMGVHSLCQPVVSTPASSVAAFMNHHPRPPTAALGIDHRIAGVVQFDTTRNRYLVAGDEFQIKFWHMDDTNILTTTDADGGLPAFPRLRFQKDGTLLAVTTSDNGIKILANADGQRVLRTIEVSRSASKQSHEQNLQTVMDSSARAADVKPRIPEETEKIKSCKLAEILNVGHLKALRLPDSTSAVSKVVRLIYTNSGRSLIALGSNAVHKLWIWQRDERNPSGKSTASVAPQLWKPSNGIFMTNDTSDSNPEEATACIALSTNDSYATSFLFLEKTERKHTLQVLSTFMPTPPAATSLAFHPEDNNIIAVGMEDSTILIYNIQIDEVKAKLKGGHQKKITGLAFSPSLNVLMSAGADAQLCVWRIDGWKKKRSTFIQAPIGCASPLVGDTQIQFHNDQTHLLAVHERQIAIYDSKLDSLCTWSPRDKLSASVSSATFSCDGSLVYAAFVDGTVGIFEGKNLRIRCWIAPSAYISGTGSAYPMVIAAHPSEPNQIALGMSDGAVHVVEPLDGDTRWRPAAPSQDNGTSADHLLAACSKQ